VQGDSSILPLQLLSLSSQISVVAPANALQVFPPHVPAMQVSFPVLLEHMPNPQWVVLVKPSSTRPLQLLSLLSHISAVGL
jgi:hypothetical protein